MRRSGRSGQGLVEFALVSVVMFSLFSGILELSWWFYNLSYLNNATNKAARMYAKNVTGRTQATAESDARTLLVLEKGGLTVAQSNVQLYDSTFSVTTTRVTGGYVKVEAEVLYGSISPFKSFIYMANMSTLRSQAMMRIE